MKKLIAICMMVLMLFVLTACYDNPPAPPRDNNPESIVTNENMWFMNIDRSKNGVPAAAWSEPLEENAKWWSCELNNGFRHQNLSVNFSNPNYTGFSRLGENIAIYRLGPAGLSYEQMVDYVQKNLVGAQIEGFLMASPSHRAAILNGSYTQVGVGTCIVAPPFTDDHLWHIYVVQEFGG